MLLQQEIAFERNERMAADKRKLQLLVEGPDEENEAGKGEHVYLARAPFQAPQVDSLTRLIAKRTLSAGELVDAVVTEAMEYDLVARPEVAYGTVFALEGLMFLLAAALGLAATSGDRARAMPRFGKVAMVDVFEGN